MERGEYSVELVKKTRSLFRRVLSVKRQNPSFYRIHIGWVSNLHLKRLITTHYMQSSSTNGVEGSVQVILSLSTVWRNTLPRR